MLSGELFATVLYVVQQLGVMLGVGAQTVLLCAFLVFVHRKEADNAHTGFVRAVRVAQTVGLVLMIGSGLGAVAFHYMSNTLEVLLAPAFIFKWILIAVVLLCYLAEKRLTHGLGRGVLEGFAGASWYALFLVHSLAPVAALSSLGIVYGLWVAAFGVLWAVFAAVMHVGGGHKVAIKMPALPKMPVMPQIQKPIIVPPPVVVPKPIVAAVAPKVEPPKPIVPKPVAPPPPPPKPIVHAPLPVVVLRELPASHVAPPPAIPVPKPPVAAPPPAPPKAPPLPPLEQVKSLFADHSPWLRALHIMPKTQEDADKHHSMLQIT